MTAQSWRPETARAEPSGLREYAVLLWRKRVTILVVAAICVGATLAYSILTKPTYEASASVLLARGSRGWN